MDDEQKVMMPLECVDCGVASGPLHPLDGEHAGWLCPACYAVLNDCLDEEDEYDEPVDSCDECGTNIYADEDDGSGLCGQCQWRASAS